ncbi:hypothetical protein VPHK225_0060 [Vibrio phage K225]
MDLARSFLCSINLLFCLSAAKAKAWGLVARSLLVGSHGFNFSMLPPNVVLFYLYYSTFWRLRQVALHIYEHPLTRGLGCAIRTRTRAL